MKISLRKSMSKTEIKLIAEKVKNSDKLLDELIKIIISDKKDISWRAAHILDEICIKDISAFEKYKNELTEFVLKTNDNSIKRHLCKLISKTEIQEKYHSAIIDEITKNLTDKNVRVAVKVHCLEVFYNLTKIYPDLTNELILIINELHKKNSIAFKTRAKIILKKIQN